MKILLASNNAKKRKELERILAASHLFVVTPRDLGLDLVPEENGRTFAENALIKARAFSEATDLPVLADDSGLIVDALDGAPGVHSARFAGPNASDADNRAKLLTALSGVPVARRTARFICSLALVRRGELLASVEDTCEGRILETERGTGGFGYDPLFLHEASGQTFADLADDKKDAVSHRGRALRRLETHLEKLRD